jgi:hypothetical protein
LHNLIKLLLDLTSFNILQIKIPNSMGTYCQFYSHACALTPISIKYGHNRGYSHEIFAISDNWLTLLLSWTLIAMDFKSMKKEYIK